MSKFTSGFATVDIKNGRKIIADRLKERPVFGICPIEMRTPVVITGYICHSTNDDDGESQEFAVTVENLEVKL
jgi:hypothetical protein